MALRRDRREQVIKLTLSAAYAEDVIEMAAFPDRLSRAHAAADLHATLDALVADLGVPVAETALVPVARSEAMIPVGQRVLAVFSSIERRGAWRAHRNGCKRLRCSAASSSIFQQKRRSSPA